MPPLGYDAFIHDPRWGDLTDPFSQPVIARYRETHEGADAKATDVGHGHYAVLIESKRLKDIPGWADPAPEPEPLPPVDAMTGNFLATPDFALDFVAKGPVGFMYPAMSADEKKRYVEIWQQHQWNQMPMAVWDFWGAAQGWPLRYTYDYLSKPQAFVDEVVGPLREQGIRVILMGLTERADQQPYGLSKAKTLLDQIMPTLRPHIDHWCTGFEVNQDILRDWDDEVALCAHMRPMTAPGSLLTWHGSNLRWGPRPTNDQNGEGPFWDVADCDGLLFQVPKNYTVAETEARLYDFKPLGGGVSGIAGRMVKQKHKKIWLLEGTHDPATHDAVVQMLARRNADPTNPTVSGYN